MWTRRPAPRAAPRAIDLSCVDDDPEGGADMMARRGGERNGKRRHSAFSARPIVAAVLALFVVLQGLVPIGSSLARPDHRGVEASFVASPGGVTCAGDERDGSHSPLHERGQHCCVFCSARDFDGVATPVTDKTSDSTFSQWIIISIGNFSAEAPRKPPAGWASAWSQQAPPSFS